MSNHQQVTRSGSPTRGGDARRGRSADKNWWKEGPTPPFTTDAYYSIDEWSDITREAESLTKAELLRKFEETYNEFQNFESTQVVPTLQTEEDYTELSLEAQRIATRARLYGTLSEDSEKNTNCWKYITSWYQQIKHAYEIQQQVTHAPADPQIKNPQFLLGAASIDRGDTKGTGNGFANDNYVGNTAPIEPIYGNMVNKDAEPEKEKKEADHAALLRQLELQGEEIKRLRERDKIRKESQC